jgi:uncharacterized protein YjbI with pentapeptide repeats
VNPARNALQKCALTGAGFPGADITLTIFNECVMDSSAKLRGALLNRTALLKTSFPGYDFSNMKMEFVRFTFSAL